MNEAKLPDFDEMYALIAEIRDLAIEVAKLDLKIKAMEGEVFVEGREKDLPVSQVTNAYKTGGFNGELIPFREALAEKHAELRFKENVLALQRSKIDVWRSVSANERLGIS